MINKEKVIELYIQKIKDCNNINSINKINSEFLNKKGIVYQNVLINIKNESVDRKKELGKLANEIVKKIKELSSKKILDIEENEASKQYLLDTQNFSINKRYLNFGAQHPLNIIINKVKNFFYSMNFSVYEYNEITLEKYNFDNLNIPKNHISRNTNDTFFLNDNYILRTHCTNFTSYYLGIFAKNPKINDKAVCIGNVYRRDTHDATHTHQFMQVDGFCIGNYDLGNLKYLLEEFVYYIFDKRLNIKFRPSFFPFTSPSLEVDVLCYLCEGKGCNICKHMGWIEILGAGILHEKVITSAGLDSNKYSGIAFGIGIERLAMIKFNVKDIRLFYDNNLKFLSQFKGRF